MNAAAQQIRGRDHHLIVLLLVCLANVVFLSVNLVVDDLVADYPFMGGDSHDWLANGLFLAGFDVRYSVRPPMLPLLVAALEHLSVLEALPIVLVLLWSGTCVLLYLVLRERGPRSVAVGVGLTLLFSHAWQGFGVQIMADVPAACLLFAGAYCFLRAVTGNPRWYLAAGLLIGLSCVTQQLALLFPLPAAVAVLGHRREHLRRPELWVGGAAGVLPFIVWSLLKLTTFGTPGDVVMRNWSLLEFHVDAVGSYALAAASLLGLPALALSGVGLGLLAAGGRRRVDDAFVAAMIASIIVFFVFLYDYQSKRLLVYLLPFSGIALAEALTRLRRPAVRWPLFGLVAACAVMPSPRVDDHRWTAIWPAPPTFARSLGWRDAGAVGKEPGSLVVETRSFGDLLRWSSPARVLEARRRLKPGPRMDYTRYRSCDSVVWIHERPVTPGDRYQAGLRMGNILRKRVKHVSLAMLRPHAGGLGARREAVFEGHDVFRVSLPSQTGSWLVVAELDGSASAWLERHDQTPERPPPGARDAANLVALTGARPMVVVLDGDASDPSMLFLPFLARSPEFYVLERERFERTSTAFDSGAPEAMGRVGRARVSRVRATGREWAIVEFR
jgi:hypothetical protein